MKNIFIIFFSWLFPGFGQIALGYVGHGIVIFMILASTYFVGMSISDYLPIQQPYYMICHLGVPTFFACTFLFTKSSPIVDGTGFEIGMVYMCVVGILNIIILLHLMEKLSEPPSNAKES